MIEFQWNFFLSFTHFALSFVRFWLWIAWAFVLRICHICRIYLLFDDFLSIVRKCDFQIVHFQWKRWDTQHRLVLNTNPIRKRKSVWFCSCWCKCALFEVFSLCVRTNRHAFDIWQHIDFLLTTLLDTFYLKFLDYYDLTLYHFIKIRKKPTVLRLKLPATS